MRVLAYVYNGFHAIAERDVSFYPGFTEWDLIEASGPRFAGHAQPLLPATGRYDDTHPAVTDRRVAWCQEFGIDGLVHGFFWCRGKRVFQDALDLGYLGSTVGQRFPFALMWANRMPRRVLPVRDKGAAVIDPSRQVPADVDDFVALVCYLGERYFARENYIRVNGAAYFSIFDSSFFLRELGRDQARQAIALARAALQSRGLPPLHLAAVEPQGELLPWLKSIGFDSVTHYVLLPEWKGPFLQDYDERARASAQAWPQQSVSSGLPYHPAVSPGWDASARGHDFGAEKPRKYPWWPVVVNAHPALFEASVRRAVRFVRNSGKPEAEQLVFIASLNEWSEGHYLEPDNRFGDAWLRAVQRGRAS